LIIDREFNPGIRVTDAPENTKVVVAACESAFYNLSTKVNLFDQFWIKGEPYSLHHMLNNHPLADEFVGGTVFQGFLEVTGYHRWHSPCDGAIKEIVSVPGSYFVQSPATLNDTDSNPYLRSLSFITAITARMLVFIQADDPAIGLMCFVALGMTEISTCEATVVAGQHVAKGDQLGMFHFGGKMMNGRL
jgi:phosphatidylserine decarboxylase